MHKYILANTTFQIHNMHLIVNIIIVIHVKLAKAM